MRNKWSDVPEGVPPTRVHSRRDITGSRERVDKDEQWVGRWGVYLFGDRREMSGIRFWMEGNDGS